MSAAPVEATMVDARPTRRGTSNGNSSGSSTDRRRRREWLLETYRADVDVRVYKNADGSGGDLVGTVPLGSPHVIEVGLFGDVTTEAACRCYRCGVLLTLATLTVDRIVPGCVKTAKYPTGGTYVRENIRPACGPCNSETGGQLAHGGAR